MQFYCSKAAAEALETTQKGKVKSWLEAAPVPEAAGPWAWQVHAIKLARQNVFIVMERETRFAMVFWGIKKGDGETLLKQFYERMVNLLLCMNQDVNWLNAADADVAIEQILQRNKRYCFVAGVDRSVQTHINEVARFCEGEVHEIGSLLMDADEAAGFDEAMNDTLRSVRGGDYFYPNAVFFCSWARQYAGASDELCLELEARFQRVRHERMAMRVAKHSDSSIPVYEQIMAVLQGKGLKP
ncbi:hypothetical protein R6242_09185 [Iodobacter sp. CM08]|uniref:DUF6933 domain-containing protein n=1 Tax=Iodobacter sp. CM08 TaxID=3085902 RepID=UPI00298211DC|nr:hypothetical protein [Iodobacter sp. CM08]MDW5416743.1 hypothetical protein [Iodobacter sp. CM08]